MKKYFINWMRRLRDKRGIVLLSAYWMISVMAIFSLGIFSRSNVYTQSVERNFNRVVAFNMAEAGVDLAIAQLIENPGYTGTNGYVSLSTNTVEGGFDVAVTIPPNNPNTRMISVTGHSPSNTATDRAYEARGIVAYAEIAQDSLFDFAVFSELAIQINGNSIIDSYDSRDGAYDAANPSHNGDIGTNATGSSRVDLNGNVTVFGDAEVGAGGNPNSVINVDGHAEITGSRSAMTSPKVLDTPITPAGAVFLGNLQLTGNTTYYLGPGTYSINKFKIGGNAKLIATGDVKLYISQSMDIGGNGIATAQNNPPSMLIYVTGSEDVQFNGNGAFYGGIYAPNATFQTNGNAGLYGAVVTKDFQQNGNADIHYDEALSDIEGSGSGGVSMKSWSESNTYAG